MNNTKLVLYITVILSLLSNIVFATAAVRENWMNVTLGGEKLGYYHETRKETIREGHPVIELRSEMNSKLKRFGMDFEVSQVSLVILSSNLVPVYSRYDETMMGSERTVISFIRNKKLVIQTIIGDATTETERDWSPKIQYDSSILEILIRKGLPSGYKEDFQIFAPELGKEFTVSVSIGSTKRIGIGGIWRQTKPIHIDFSGAQELSADYFLDDNGQVVKAEVGNYGMAMIQTTESDAKSLGQRLEIADLSRVTSNVDLSDSEQVTRLKLRITVDNAPVSDYIPVSRYQYWVGDSSGREGILMIESPAANQSYPANYPVLIKSKEFSLFTSSSPYIEASDYDIQTTAKSVVGKEKNAWKAAIHLADWVHGYVENKGFDTGFASARQTWKDKKGDCTEHSVLLAALTRSLGIPTKVVVGLAAVESGFYYHMWTEVYVGEWVSLDPTFNEFRLDAAHIKLGESRTKEDELGDYALQLLKTLKKIKIQVLEYTANGKTIKINSETQSNP